MSEKMEAVATSEAPAALGAYSQAVTASWALIRPPANWRARPLESRLHRR